MSTPPSHTLRQVISADQIQKRVRELGRQISDDYRGQSVVALGILENSFMFMADLVRAVDVPMVCTFIKPRYKQLNES
ncbi:MAG TPA: phosphoribosyltransferase family protein, partial [Terriglobales bacterium]|nr:phosphoribosyltransferase family protein [Terriglobales bacterium]